MMRDSAFCFPARLSSDICVCPCAVLKPSNAAMNRSAWFIGYSGQEVGGEGKCDEKTPPQLVKMVRRCCQTKWLSDFLPRYSF